MLVSCAQCSVISHLCDRGGGEEGGEGGSEKNCEFSGSGKIIYINFAEVVLSGVYILCSVLSLFILDSTTSRARPPRNELI